MKATFIRGTVLLFCLCLPYEAKTMQDPQYLKNLFNQFYNVQQQQTYRPHKPYYGIHQYTNSIVPTNFQQNPNVQNLPWNAGQYPIGVNQLGSSIFPYYLTNSDTPVFSSING